MNDKLFALYKYLYTRNGFLEKIVRKRLLKAEKGELYASSLRRLFAECHHIVIGQASYGCFDKRFNFGSPFVVGNYCSIAEGVKSIPGNHPYGDVSTHPFFHVEKMGFCERIDEIDLGELTIGHDVWIGMNAMILPGCRNIGNGAIIGAGAVVTKDVPPYAIVVGNPATIKKFRFNDSEIKMLEESKWWDLPPQLLKEAIPYRKDISKFVEVVKQTKKNYHI